MLLISFDRSGEVTCIRLIRGQAMLVQSAIDSVKKWKFQTGAESACGPLVLALSTLEPGMGLKVLDADPGVHKQVRKSR